MLIGYRSASAEYAHRFEELIQSGTFQVARETGWAIAAQAGPDTRWVLRNDKPTGLAVGKLFANEPVAGTVTHAQLTSRRSGQRVWGRFSAAWYCPDTACHYLRVDPLAYGDLFIHGNPDCGWVFSSSLTAIAGLLGPGVRPDWEVLGATLMEASPYRLQAAGRTPLLGVRQLTLGHAATIDSDGLRIEQSWNPADTAGTRSTEISNEEIRDCLRSSVHAWSRDTSGVTAQLSGGLDSSAVCWAAASSGQPQLQALHIDASPLGPEAQESHYATRVASHLGIPLIHLPAEDLLPLSSHDQLPLPTRPDLMVLLGRQRQILDEVCGDGILLTGIGGDQLFSGGHGIGWAHDLALTGQKRRAVSDLATVAYRTGTPVWAFLWQLARAERARWRGFSYLALAAEAPGEGPVWARPEWFCAHRQQWLPVGGPRAIVGMGRAQHILGLIDLSVAISNMTARNDSMRHPLYSLPLVELFLRAPMRQLVNVDLNRPTVREALRGQLPTSVVNRADKTSHTVKWTIGLRRHADTARELIRDGAFGRIGAIDVDKALTALEETITGAQNHPQVLNLIATERWLELWRPLLSTVN